MTCRQGRICLGTESMTCIDDSLGERHASGADADKCQFLDATVTLEDLVCDARERAPDADGVHHYGHNDA